MATDAQETLEARIAARNGLTFFREFTFAKNGFQPTPGTTAELADNIIWMDDYLCLIQLKQRTQSTDDPVVEAKWFDKTVLDKGTRQIRDGLNYLEAHPEIRITNEKGHPFAVRRAALKRTDKVVLYEGAKALPSDRRRITHHVSRTAGFIHILSLEDYLGVMEVLVTPGDIQRYLEYREAVLLAHADTLKGLNEASLVGHYIGGDPETLPAADSVMHLARLIQDTDAFDMSGILSQLSEHVIRIGQPGSYYSIMLELARLPRSVLRQFKLRFVKAMAAARNREWTRPFRFHFPETDCAFMISPMHPDLPGGAAASVEQRLVGLQNLTVAAKYEARTRRAIGVIIAKVGPYYEIEWCFMESDWADNPELAARLAEHSPFRPVVDRDVDGFVLVGDD